MKNKYVYVVIVIVTLAVICCANNNNSHASEKSKNNLANVEVMLPTHSDKELIVMHKGYTLAYNTKYNTPKWVAWTLTKEKTYGNLDRATKFNPDPLIPKGYRVDWYEYKESGYDRGHMCPSGDNKWDIDAMNECFYMSNICPQDRKLNDGWWNALEKACRGWARKEGCLYIVCGPVYKKNAKRKEIGMQHKITVPDGFFKVVLTLREGNQKAVGFYYKNDASEQPMRKVAMTVDEIEKMTGIDFYPSLDDELEERLESTLSML